jgi:TET-associated glycosyltransferase-like protein
MNPKYPIYIPSKSRWERQLTHRVLTDIQVPHFIVVEPQERDQYDAATDKRFGTILTLPFSNLGLGAVPARNWIKEHSLSLRAERHWQIDDDIVTFARLWNNRKIRVGDGTIFKAAEDFSDRYENVAVSGFHYWSFVKRKDVVPPFYLNRRVYTTCLINNSVPYGWRGRYNDDTDFSLRVLKDGWCTVNFCAFLAWTETTMTSKGGMTDMYQKSKGKEDGRLKMAMSLVEQHPDVTTITWRFNHWQHLVNYEPFKNNRLKLKSGIEIKEGVDNYGMVLQESA